MRFFFVSFLWAAILALAAITTLEAAPLDETATAEESNPESNFSWSKAILQALGFATSDDSAAADETAAAKESKPESNFSWGKAILQTLGFATSDDSAAADETAAAKESKPESNSSWGKAILQALGFAAANAPAEANDPAAADEPAAANEPPTTDEPAAADESNPGSIFSWGKAILQAPITFEKMVEDEHVPEILEVVNELQNKGDQCGLSGETFAKFEGVTSNINYLLFTPSNREEACDLQPNEESLNKCQFDPGLETKVIMHGWTEVLPPEDLKFVMKDKILEAGPYNVVVHNWTAYTQNYDLGAIGYTISAVRSIEVGVRLAAWIRYLQNKTGVKPESFHLIPHSLGSEVASFAGKSLCGLGRITFFDPAAPIFRFMPMYLKPNENDANYVEAIHTNAGATVLEGASFLEPIGDIDFFPNGGEHQPKCYDGAPFQYGSRVKDTVNSKLTRFSCDHYAVYEYYLESFDKQHQFSGLICDDYESYANGKCMNSPHPIKCEMGFYSKRIPNLPIHSKCYFNTATYSPFSLM